MSNLVRTSHADPVTGIDSDSAQFRERARRVVLSEDPDTATAQTVEVMCGLVKLAARDPFVQAIAHNAVRRFAGMSRNAAEACWWWAKHFLRFKHHGDQFEAWSAQLGDPNTKLQLLIAPDVLVRMRKMEGDCAIYTMMVCAMLETLGIAWRICPCAVNHGTPTIFSHVFARAAFQDGTWESLDASHGPAPGWQVPKRDMLRLWIFNENGQKIGEQGGHFTGLHDYRPGRGLRSYPRRGLGIGEAEDWPEGGSYVPPNYDNPTQVFGTFDSGAGFSPNPSWWDSSSGNMTAPSQNSAQWAGFASQLAKMGFTLAQINAIQPGTVVQPNGTIIRQSPGFAVPVGSQIAASLGGSSSLLYIGVGLVALLAVGSMFKGGR